MAAAVHSERRDSLVGRNLYSSSSLMDRDYHSAGRPRSPRFHDQSSKTAAAMEEPQRSSSPSRSQIKDWRYPRHESSSLKRRNSQRSSSRPRSSHIDKEPEGEHEKQNEAQDDHQQQQSHDSEPRKVARMSHQHHQKNASSGGSRGGQDPSAEWASKRAASRMSDSEPTSASSRLMVSHSRTPSAEEAAAAAAAAAAERRNSGHGRDEDQGSNYTWRRERHQGMDDGDIKSEGNISASGSDHRLPTFRSMAAPAGPLAAASYARHSSPSPRLPSFASLAPQASSSRHAMGAEGYSIARYPSPRQSGAPSVSSGQSPSMSVSSQAPGQAFIHPALAGLPGAGGVAGSKQQPSFVSKLYSMLEDTTIEDMISWGPSGTVFSVANPAEFSKVVLPNWFKHSNWQSFVRQLNMYGFHKVNHTYQGTPEEEIQVWEFKHPSFRRGEVQLLNDIKRKSSRHKRQESMGHSAADYEGRSPGSTTPSPEIAIQYMAPPGARGVPPPGGSSQFHRQHQASRSLGGAPGYSRYSEYVQPSMGPSRHHHGMTSSSTFPPGPGDMMRHEEQEGPLIAGEGSSARMDDLSDRIDAIIRHASYLESQLRSVSDQLYQSQQNGVNLGRHVSHLEAQMRGIEERLMMQSQHSAPPSSEAHQHAGSSSSRTAIASSSARDMPRGIGHTNPPLRSPSLTHPSYSPSHARKTSSGAVTYSSADAYQNLPPPRSSSIRREGDRSPI
jgi:hypothetical protein